MNTKKIFAAALTVAMAVSAAAVSVSAIAPGTTTDTAKQTIVVEPGKVTHFSVTINDVTIDADVPADVIAAGEELTFGANVVTNVDIEAAVAGLADVATSEILDVFFQDADGDNVAFANAGVDVKITSHDMNAPYEVVYIYEEGTGLNELAKDVNGVMSFKAPHFSYYVLVKNGKVDPGQPSDVSNGGNNGGNSNGGNNGSNGNNGDNNGSNNGANNGGVNTGDSTATVAVFGIIGAAALGTAIVASKSKKSAK